MPKIVNPKDGSVWNLTDAEAAKARAMGGVDFGSPEHIAAMGVKGPDAAMPAPADIAKQVPMGQYGDPVTAGVAKSIIGTGVGALDLIGRALNKGQQVPDPTGLRQLVEPGEAESTPKTVTDIAQFFLPEAIAAKAGEGVEAANMASKILRRVRGPGGRMTKDMAIRGTNVVVPKVNSVAEANRILGTVARAGTRATAAGALNKVQGGDFTTGAAVSAAGTAGGQALKTLAPYAGMAPRAGSTIGHMALGGYGGYIYGHGDPGKVIAGALLGKALDARLTRKAAEALLRNAPKAAPVVTGSALQFDRLPMGHYKARVHANSNSVTTPGDSRAHVNKGD